MVWFVSSGQVCLVGVHDAAVVFIESELRRPACKKAGSWAVNVGLMQTFCVTVTRAQPDGRADCFASYNMYGERGTKVAACDVDLRPRPEPES